jgi:hypothetical protein
MRMQIVGGVALAQPVYAAALYAEGRVPEPATSGCQLLFAVAKDGGGLQLVPATQVRVTRGACH